MSALSEAMREIDRLNDRVIELQRENYTLRAKQKKILDWCNGNIVSKCQVTPFCTQVRDLIEHDVAPAVTLLG